MASTNHTATFLSLRENYQRRKRGGGSSSSKTYHRRDSKQEPLNNTDEQETSELNNNEKFDPRFILPPVWVDSKDACESIIQEIHELMLKLSEAHKNRLLVRMDDDERRKDKEVEILAAKITKQFRTAEIPLKKIGKIDENTSNLDLNIRLNVQRSLASKLQQLSLDFRKRQKEYLNKLKNQKLVSSNISMLNDDEENTSSAFLLSQEEEVALQSNSKRIHERDIEITKIAKSIEDLSLVFKQLAVLVIEQGTLLDRIDYNMDLVVDKTQHGVFELEKAEKYQKSNRAQYCILILVILIVIFFGIIVAKIS